MPPIGYGTGAIGGSTAGVAPAAAAPVGSGMSCLSGLSKTCSSCTSSCCNSPFGQLLSNILKPFSMMTGGLVPVPCQQTGGQPGGGGSGSQDGGAESTANKIKQEEADAKARIAALKYLATCDCHYFPEAGAAIVLSLRTDKNECVRWQAARSLQTGCCCNPKVIEALTLTVSGNNKDGNPAETSPRVQSAACLALQLCLARHPPTTAPADTELRRPEEPSSVPGTGRPPPKTESPGLPSRTESEVIPPGRIMPDSSQQLPGNLLSTPGGVPPAATANSGGVVRRMADPEVRPAAYDQPSAPSSVAPVIEEAQRVLRAATAVRPAVPPTGHRSLLEIWQTSAATRK